MPKWTLRLGIPFLIAMVTVAALYECSTHVVRGWLSGEAFYDGRPTSYWRIVVLAEVEQPPSSGWWAIYREWAPDRDEVDMISPLILEYNADDVLKELAADDQKSVATFVREILEVHHRDRSTETDFERRVEVQFREIKKRFRPTWRESN